MSASYRGCEVQHAGELLEIIAEGAGVDGRRHGARSRDRALPGLLFSQVHTAARAPREREAAQRGEARRTHMRSLWRPRAGGPGAAKSGGGGGGCAAAGGAGRHSDRRSGRPANG